MSAGKKRQATSKAKGAARKPRGRPRRSASDLETRLRLISAAMTFDNPAEYDPTFSMSNRVMEVVNLALDSPDLDCAELDLVLPMASLAWNASLLEEEDRDAIFDETAAQASKETESPLVGVRAMALLALLSAAKIKLYPEDGRLVLGGTISENADGDPYIQIFSGLPRLAWGVWGMPHKEAVLHTIRASDMNALWYGEYAATLPDEIDVLATEVDRIDREQRGLSAPQKPSIRDQKPG